MLHDNVIKLLINLAEDCPSPAERIAALAEARFWIADQRILTDRAAVAEYFGMKVKPAKTDERLERMVKAVIVPFDTRDGVTEAALRLYRDLTLAGIYAVYDDLGNLGQRIHKHHKGEDFLIIVDSQTLTDNTVVLRRRNGYNVRINIPALRNLVVAA